MDKGVSSSTTGLSSDGSSQQAVSPVPASIPDAAGNCKNCGGGGWVCENHPDLPWGGLSAREDACDCVAGSPCGVCNLGIASAVFVDRREKAIAAWLRGLEPSHSGWNPHDEQYDSGWDAAIEWVADQIARGKHWAFAQAIEARSDETRSGSAVGESAVRQDAPNSFPPTPPSKTEGHTISVGVTDEGGSHD